MKKSLSPPMSFHSRVSRWIKRALEINGGLAGIYLLRAREYGVLVEATPVYNPKTLDGPEQSLGATTTGRPARDEGEVQYAGGEK